MSEIISAFQNFTQFKCQQKVFSLHTSCLCFSLYTVYSTSKCIIIAGNVFNLKFAGERCIVNFLPPLQIKKARLEWKSSDLSEISKSWMAIISKLRFNNGRVILKYAKKHSGSMYSMKMVLLSISSTISYQTESVFLCLRSVAESLVS